jgi:DNA-binding NarL/FixJ family response regulator
MYHYLTLFDTIGASCVRQRFIVHQHSSSGMMQDSSKKQIKVLFVDDDEEFLKSAKQCLKLKGNFDIETAFSVDEALEKMKTNKPDAIICDIQMPLADGFEFLKALRDSEYDVPFIVFTVSEDKETALKAFKLGANGFVGKSGDPEVVFSTLQRCIEKSVIS